MEQIINRLKTSFTVTEVKNQRNNLVFVKVPKEQAIAAVTHLRDAENYKHLVMITVADWLEDGIFELSYIVHNYDTHTDIAIKTDIARENATMQTAHHLWSAVWTYQRELKEMYGIDFPGSPRVDEDFCLEGWDEMPPMRRDFDTLKYSEETYFERPGRSTNDPATYMKQKLYPNE